MEPIPKTEKELLFAYLDKIIAKESGKLVGKILKRFEVFYPEAETSNDDSNKTIKILKRDLKEIIWEHSRELQDIFTAYSYGIETSYFDFTKSKEKDNGK